MANSLGTLTPKKVVLDVFRFLRQQFPLINSISTDFSDEQANFNQQIVSRVPTIPTVADYHTTNGYVAGDAATTDVPVTINAHKHVSLAFGEQELSGTNRNLVEEQKMGAAYALAKGLFDAVCAQITVANYANETVSTVANSDRDTLTALRKVLNTRGVGNPRFAIVNGDVAEKLDQDSRIISSDYGRPGGTEEDNGWLHLQGVAGFRSVWEYPDLPTDENLTGFAGTKDGLVVATRVPKDPALVVSNLNLPGTIEVVTDPDTGMSMMVRYHYDMTLGKLQMTMTWMYGVGVGVAGNIQRLVHTANP